MHMLNIVNCDANFLFFKPEVYAAREKNGIYIPRDRYLQDEAEKKVHLQSIINIPTIDLC